MALNKILINNQGIMTTYHKIGHVSLRNNDLNCVVESYVSKDYRELDRSADNSFFSFNITTEEEESMGIRQLCYTKIKELPEWSDAEDC